MPRLDDPPGETDEGEVLEPLRDPVADPPLLASPLEPLLASPRDDPTLDCLRDPPREGDGEGDRDENSEGDNERREVFDTLLENWLRSEGSDHRPLASPSAPVQTGNRWRNIEVMEKRSARWMMAVDI